MKVKITYSTEKFEIVETEHTTLEAFCNEKFGSAIDAFNEMGGTLEILYDTVEEAAVAAATAAEVEAAASASEAQAPVGES